jgi:MYXO-CTERM domain-containing protein
LEDWIMNHTAKSQSLQTSHPLRWLGAPSLLALVAAAVGACSSDQPSESIGRSQQAATTDILINEVDFDPKGAGTASEAYQYIELSGPPGASLQDYYVLFVDGRTVVPTGTPATGAVLAVANLTTACTPNPCHLGSDGLLVVTRNSTGGFTFPAATTRVAWSDPSPYSMPNNTNGPDLPTPTACTTAACTDDYSVLLVTSSTAITRPLDLDPTMPPSGTAGAPSGVGVLTLPTGAVLMDALGWRESLTGLVYGGVDVKPNTLVQDSPSAIIRIDGNTDPLSASAWFTAEYTAAGTGATTTLVSIAAAVPGTTLPPVTNVTPGAPNVAASGIAGAAGAAGIAGIAGSAGVATNGGTAGTTTVVEAGTAGIASGVGGLSSNAGTAGTAGTIVVVATGGAPTTGGAPPTAGAPPATGGTTVVAAGAPGTGGIAAAGAPVTTGGTVGAAGSGDGGVVVAAGTSGVTEAGAAGLSASNAGAAGTWVEAGAPSAAGAATAGTKNTGGATTRGGSAGTAGKTATSAGTTAKATGGASTGGAKATGGKPAVGGASSALGGSTDTGEADDTSSGCGCRTVGKSQTPATGLVTILALAGALLSRRRRRS